MPSTKGRRWTISRRDLAAGGAALVRIAHPLLPEFSRSRVADTGLVLAPAVPAPAPLAPLGAQERRAYLARLAALLGFLKFHGLGIAAGDLDELGARPGDPARPALGAPPVPAWRAVPPGLALAAAAVRLAGGAASGGDAGALRASVERAVEQGLPGEAAEDAISALRGFDAGARVEALASEFAARAGPERPPGREFAGLAFPGPFVTRPEGTGPAAASGRAAAWLARAAARRNEIPVFVECGPASALEEGAALRRLADALDPDPRAAELRALAAGERSPRRDDGPSVAVVALDADRWDARSHRALAADLPAMGFQVFEASGTPPRPWVERPPLTFRLGEGDAAALLYLPFASMSVALSTWRDAETSAASDPARFLDAARDLAARFDARTGRVAPERKRSGSRPNPVVEASSLLADGFGAEEAAAAAGREGSEAEIALAAAEAAGLLAPADGGTYRFRGESERARRAARIPVAARRDAVARLEALSLPPARFVPAALARGEPRDLAAARDLLAHARETAGGESLAVALFARAPRGDRDLGRPLLAVAALAAAGLDAAARAAAARIGVAEVGAPLPERIAAARALVRLGESGRALGLLDGPGPAERVARAALLVELRREAEARRVLDRLEASGPAVPREVRVEAILLAAELDERAHRYAEAAKGLAEAERLLGDLADRDLAARAARTAGYLANDLGRTEEAIALFRSGGELARDERGRADAAYDVAHAALDGGRLDLAARELDDALARYAALDDEARYLSALGNRIDLFLRAGDPSAARPVLERVLAHERAAGRAHQILFAIPSLQELALLDGDPEGAAAAFREAESLRGPDFGAHPAWREILLLEAERRLGAGDATGAARALDEAGAIPDNTFRTETRRRRLAESVRRDLGRPRSAPDLSSGERALLAAEAALAAGEPLPEAAFAEFERRSAGREAGSVVRRLFEWSGRFTEQFRGPAGTPLARLGRRAASRAGLARAEARFSAVLDDRAAGALRRPEPRPRSASVVAEDPSSRAVLDEVARIAPARLTLLVRGESGTGKEIIAQEAHRLSGRRGPFVAVNLAALPATLAESELFGHARGAFSGADRDRRGLVEESSGGTLFLDEIGDLTPPLQGKLLRVLQEKEVRRLGETAVRRVDLRVVAATHRDLAALVDRGEFRGDLYYRIAGHEVVLRPLRERPRDLEALLAQALAGATLAPEARRLVLAHRWPGNVRELLAVVESARALAAPDRVIRAGHLPRALRREETERAAARTWRQKLDEARREAIESSLVASGGRRAEAARLLGISRQSLLYEIKKLGIGTAPGGR